MTVRGRFATVLALFLVVVGLVVWAVDTLITPGVPGGAIDYTKTAAPGQPVNLVLQTDGAVGVGSHPLWVGYLAKNPTTGKWQQTTEWKVPAHTVVHVTIDQYDSGSPLRNQQFGQVTGTTGGVAYLNGKAFSHYDSYTGQGVGHTFVIPSLGVQVPLVGVGGNICEEGPCNLGEPHNTMTFSFKTPGPGVYHWQCFVPCGVGYLYGNGGGMSTEGYMGGFLDVVA